MASEHESAVEAWLDNADTQAEMQVIARRFPEWDRYQVVTFALLMEMLVATEIHPTLTVVDGEDPPDPDEMPRWLDDDDDEDKPWKRAN